MDVSGLSGLVILITGAGRGMGRSIAEAAAAKGAAVVAGSRTLSELESLSSEIGSNGGTCLPILLDVTDPDSINRFVDTVLDRFGRIDGLVNNVGAGITVPTVEHTRKDYDRIIELNLTSTFLCSQRVALSMIASGRGGSIVNISSVFGQGGVAGRAVYCAAKAAVDSLTQSFAVEWATDRIRVNAVAPGVVNTPAFERARRNAPDLVAGVQASIPIGRIVEPAEIAALVTFLLSNACGSMTGQILTVDGGLTAALPGSPRSANPAVPITI